jgi:hypothetical protein
MRSDQWQTYRTRFLIKAKQLDSNLSFTDHLGRHHCGRKGDYLVESSDGVLSIAPRRIFEDIYVSMTPLNVPSPERVTYANLDRISPMNLQPPAIESLQVQTLHARKVSTRAAEPRRTAPFSSAVRRKAPQPVRSTRHPAQLGLM